MLLSNEGTSLRSKALARCVDHIPKEHSEASLVILNMRMSGRPDKLGHHQSDVLIKLARKKEKMGYLIRRFSGQLPVAGAMSYFLACYVPLSPVFLEFRGSSCGTAPINAGTLSICTADTYFGYFLTHHITT